MLTCFPKAFSNHIFGPKSEKEKAVDFHKAVLATRIIKLIQSKVYKEFQLNKPSVNAQNKQSSVSSKPKSVEAKNQSKPANAENQSNSPLLSQQMNGFYSPLKSKIIDLIEKYEDPKILPSESSDVQNAKRWLLSYFQGGVWLHPIYCSQKRFQDLEKSWNKINKTQEVVDQSFFTSQITTKYKKITFCPTYFTTSQVFQRILSSKKYLVLTGHFGIGKTYSFILYRVLSDIIFQYKHKHNVNWPNYPPEIDFELPKAVYWNADLKETRQDKIKQVIFGQCYEINKKLQELKKHKIIQHDLLGNMEGNNIMVNQIYQKLDITPILMVDQISSISGAIRNFKIMKQYEKYKKQQKETDKQGLPPINKQHYQRQYSQEQRIKIILKFKNAQKLNRIRQNLGNQFQKVIHLSSQTIQQDILKDMDLTGSSNHGILHVEELLYREYLDLPPTVSDMTQFIVYQIKQYMQRQNNEDTCIYQNEEFKGNLKSLTDCSRKILFQLLQQNHIMLSCLTIYKKFNPSGQQAISEVVTKIFLSRTEEDLKKSLNNLIISLKVAWIQQTKGKIESFLKKQINKIDKNNQHEVKRLKRILLFKLLYAAKSQKAQREKNPQFKKPQSLKIDIRQHMKHQILNNQHYIQEQIRLLLDKNVFKYSFDSGFRCLLHEEVVIELLGALEIDLLQVLLEEGENFWKLIDSPTGQGLLLESIFRKILSFEGTKFTYQASEETKNSIDFAFCITKNQEKSDYFKSIPQTSQRNYDNFYFLKSFQNIKESKKIGTFILFPKKEESSKNSKQTDLDHSSKSIDFIIYENLVNQIRISAFDTTISKDNYWQKISKFLTEIANFQDKYKSKIDELPFSLNYFVISAEEVPRSFKWNENLQKFITKLENEKASKKAEMLKKIYFEEKGDSRVILGYKDQKMFVNEIRVISFLNCKFENNVRGNQVLLELKLLKKLKEDFKKN